MRRVRPFTIDTPPSHCPCGARFPRAPHFCRYRKNAVHSSPIRSPKKFIIRQNNHFKCRKNRRPAEPIQAPKKTAVHQNPFRRQGNSRRQSFRGNCPAPQSVLRQTGLCQHPTAFIQRNHSMTTGPICQFAKRPRSQWAADSPPAQVAGTKSRTAFAAAAFCTDGLTSSPDTCAYRWRTRRE